MQDFFQLLAESKENKNLHLSHLEDLVIERGLVGMRDSVAFLQQLRNMLAGHSTSGVNITVKWDGAPSIFAGINPENKKFFVATKSLFNVDAKLNYTEDDIDRNHPSEGLNRKLKVALRYLPELKMKGIFQGDIMFTHEDLKYDTIHNERYITFQPNTIIYAVPADSKLSYAIQGAQIGVVWHTQYYGSHISELKSSFGVSVNQFAQSRNVWFRDASYIDMSGTVSFTQEETNLVNAILSQVGYTAQQIDSKFLSQLMTNTTYKTYISTYTNSKVREGTKIRNVPEHVQGLYKFIEDKWNKEIMTAKQEATKHKRIKEKNITLSFFKKNHKSLRFIFELQNIINSAKMIIVKKLENVEGNIKHFTRDADGYKVTNPEGFVAVDKMGNAVKLVDRLSFSKHNFQTNRNWSK